MGNNIPLFYVEQFPRVVQLKLQQKGSRLRDAIMTGSHVGSQAAPVDQFGAITAQKVTNRFAPMVRIDAPTDRRWVTPQDYDAMQMIDSFDKLRLLIDPMSSYVENSAYALGRAQDQEILSGILGTNLTGNQGASQVALPSAQIVSVQKGASSNTNLTVAKLKEAKRLLMQAEVDLQSDQLYCAINATAHDSLLNEVQVISSDFNGGNPVMEEGLIKRFLGINFIHTELLPSGTDDQSGTSTQVPVWAKSGVYMGQWADLTTDISQRKDLRGLPYQAYVYGTFGATRLEEKKIVQIWAR